VNVRKWMATVSVFVLIGPRHPESKSGLAKSERAKGMRHVVHLMLADDKAIRKEVADAVREWRKNTREAIAE